MSVLAKRYVVFFCVVAILAATWWGERPCAVVCADVNSDGLLDVRDVQAIAAEVLAHQSQQTGRDVNGDGQIDVRDFQAAVAELEQPSSTSHEPPERSESKAYFACDYKVGPVVLSCQVLPVVRPSRPGSSFAASRRQSKATEYSVQRFLFHLTPNAPPCLA